MYAERKQTQSLIITLVWVDSLMIFLSLFLTGGIRNHYLGLPFFDGVFSERNSINLFRGVVYCVATLWLFYRFGCYNGASRVGQFRAFVPAGKILIAVLVAAVGLIGMRSFVLGQWDTSLGTWVWIQSGILFALLLVGRVATRVLIFNVLKAVHQERVAIVGWSSRMERVLTTYRRRLGKYHVLLGFFSVSSQPEEEVPRIEGIPWRGGIGDLAKVAVNDGITVLIVDEATVSPDELREIAEVCSRSFVSLRVITSGFDVLTSQLQVETYAGIPVIGLHDLKLEKFYNRVVKRAIDIAGAVIGLILAVPFIIVFGILIYIESPGRIFYKQRRVTRNGRCFDMYKLRSMKLDAEAVSGPVWTKKDDDRRLKVGAFMRKYNIDEMPQFWNVLKGDMSLVGPRPERPEFVEVFSETVRHYNLRHTCKAGMTGWAAVHGLRGDTSLVDRIEYDLFYIENWNLFLDFKVIVMTLFPSKNAY